MNRRVAEKLCTKKVYVDLLAPKLQHKDLRHEQVCALALSDSAELPPHCRSSSLLSQRYCNSPWEFQQPLQSSHCAHRGSKPPPMLPSSQKGWHTFKIAAGPQLPNMYCHGDVYENPCKLDFRICDAQGGQVGRSLLPGFAHYTSLTKIWPARGDRREVCSGMSLCEAEKIGTLRTSEKL